MKKIKILAITAIMLVMSLALALSMTACGGGGNSNPFKLDLDYLSSMVADIGDATTLGIKKTTGSQGGAARTSTAAAASKIEKTYLVKSTEDLEHGAEFDENGLTKVTFTKKSSVTEEVYDSEGKLIDQNTTLTQEDIPAKVNKVYVLRNFTFMQFVPLVEEGEKISYIDHQGIQRETIVYLRPDDADLKIDEDGVAFFDKMYYHNLPVYQNFVIDNNTGYIYKIEDVMEIQSIYNGLFDIYFTDHSTNTVYGDDTVYDMRIKPNGELEFFAVTKSHYVVGRTPSYMRSVGDGFKDKFGTNYICTTNYAGTDPDIANTVFFMGSYGSNDTTESYVFSKEGYAVRLKYKSNSGGYDFDFAGSAIEIMMPQGHVMETSVLTFKKGTMIDRIDMANGYLYRNTRDLSIVFQKININTKECETRRISGYEEGDSSLNLISIDYDKVLMWNGNNLYWAYIYGENALEFAADEFDPGKYYIVDLEKRTEIGKQGMALGIDWDTKDWKFIITDHTGSVTYVVILNSQGIPELKKESELVAKALKSISFQPINK